MAEEQGVDAVLVDDLRARHLALDEMRRRSFRLADAVYQAILQRIGDEAR